MTLFLLIRAVALLATLVMSVFVVVLERYHIACLSDLHFDIPALRSLFSLCLKSFLDLGDLLGLQTLWEGHLEHDEVVAELVRLLVIGHTVTLHCLDLVRLDHLAWLVLYSDFTTIKMG